MVWSRSALDDAVVKYNEEYSAPQEGLSGKRTSPPHVAALKEQPCNEPPPHIDNNCERCKDCGKPRCAPPAQNPIERILNDKDALLIIGVILLLINEKADSKLILALAFVLLM